MFRIRIVYDTFLPVNRNAIEKIREIARSQIADISEQGLQKILERVNDPYYEQMRYMLIVADDSRGDVKGFALMSHDPKNRFCYLDMLAADFKKPGGGVGGSLYERARKEAARLKCFGLFFDCMAEIAGAGVDAAIKKESRARLRFYERHGARPIDNIRYEEISKKHYPNGYLLMFDSLGRIYSPELRLAKKTIRLILERKYRGIYSPEEINAVVASVRDDPLRLRPHRYRKKIDAAVSMHVPNDKKIVLVYNDGHHIHHVKERGYAESPVRVEAILRAVDATGLFNRVSIKKFPASLITEVHAKDFYDYLKMVSDTFDPGKSLYPDVFPIRKEVRKPARMGTHVGYYCIDIYSPINRNAFLAARNAVDCALTGASSLLYGSRRSYALVRPPGHHAGAAYAGGFCYLNSTAIAANFLCKFGNVAVLDIDYHHGNGQQEIFYERSDVLTVSIHASPEFEYPYFSGYADETGIGPGAGYNINYPLKRGIGGFEYMKYLRRAISYIRNYGPKFLVVAFGLDTAKGDPTGTWQLTGDDFETVGSMIGSMKLPILIVQEGGYDNRYLGQNARRFFNGLWDGSYG
ncbi:MAG: histone deacetylase family protein [Spirochaetes bacterium]|nr:histone deacetylase family protein [Spirochaetota bacterium]